MSGSPRKPTQEAATLSLCELRSQGTGRTSFVQTPRSQCRGRARPPPGRAAPGRGRVEAPGRRLKPTPKERLSFPTSHDFP